MSSSGEGGASDGGRSCGFHHGCRGSGCFRLNVFFFFVGGGSNGHHRFDWFRLQGSNRFRFGYDNRFGLDRRR